MLEILPREVSNPLWDSISSTIPRVRKLLYRVSLEVEYQGFPLLRENGLPNDAR
jgi:hypothetical protein